MKETRKQTIYLGKRTTQDLRVLQAKLAKRGEFVSDFNVATQSEKIFGDFLTENKISLVPQFRIGKYTYDFKILDYPILIEIDGSIHNLSSKRQIDYKKDRFAQIRGFKVLRFSNKETHNNGLLNNALSQIKSCINHTKRQPRQIQLYRLSLRESIILWWHQRKNKEYLKISSSTYHNSNK